MAVHVFGIRHHGPGCARGLSAALDALAPDIVLVEGPPDANESLSWIADAGLVPPVALLIHAADDPKHASFYPFAEFSPEWQALRHAARRGVPARFIDMPSAHRLALEKAKASAEQEASDAEADVADDGLRDDPIGLLAEAAGFSDHEQWWDVQVEQRLDAGGLFEGILEAMTQLREGAESGHRFEAEREAFMRIAIRSAQKEGFSRIAVVCGAWHTPALVGPATAKADTELTKGLPKLKVATTWIPWTHSRLSYQSGYGAGVESPGWYAHVWQYRERAPLVWATLAARLLRTRDLDASSANVIETVRLADTLAALRDLPAPGLRELREAVATVLCGAEPARLELIRVHLEVGEALGRVPEGAGQVPLMRDFEQRVKKLRLKLTTEQLQMELDLRTENDRERSRLFHRLRVLGVDWARPIDTGKGSGTFKEIWRLAWSPELAVELIAANLRGNTLEMAAAAMLVERARVADLTELAQLTEIAILAHVPDALDPILRELDARAATSSDVRVQMLALGPLARLVRYGDVRETRAEHVLPVLQTLFERVVVGLLPACSQLDDAAAADLVEALGAAQAACSLLDDAALKSDWQGALELVMNAGGSHPRLRGRACRLLLDQNALPDGELARKASLALSAAVPPAEAAQWIEGLVAGEGLRLVHQDELPGTLDAWLETLAPEHFQAQLPLLRRAFSSLTPPERRAVATRAKRAGGPTRPKTQPARDTFHEGRAAAVLPVLARILGVDHV